MQVEEVDPVDSPTQLSKVTEPRDASSKMSVTVQVYAHYGDCEEFQETFANPHVQFDFNPELNRDVARDWCTVPKIKAAQDARIANVPNKRAQDAASEAF